jgi:urocanate reductase
MTKLNRRTFLGAAVAGSVSAVAGTAPARAAENPCSLPKKWDETFDVVVVGSGGAGLASAVSAAQRGVKNILILEKMSFVGGNTSISGGAFNTYDPVRQKEQNIEDSPENHFKNTMAGGDQRAYPELVKTMTENSYDALKWLESMGMKFKPKVYQVYGGLYPRAHAPFGSLGSDYIKVLEPQARKLGCEIRTNSRVTRVVREQPLSGEVLGVEYTDKAGKVHAIRALKSVICATGGFGANPQMRAKYDPRFLNLTTTNLPCSTGDLIPLLEDIGADTTGMDFIQCNPGCPPGRHHRVVMHLNAANFIMVGRDAKRFVAEDERRDVIRDAVLALPTQTGFSIVDSNGFADLNPGHQAGAKKGLETGDAWTADTIEELGKKMGVDPAQLKKTVDEYNKIVDAKKDPLGKKPRNLRRIEKAPFWACYAGMSVHHTMGGIIINKYTQVIDRYGKVIPHLHAVGELTGGIHGTNRLGGNAICDIFTFGRLTGIAVAEGK